MAAAAACRQFVFEAQWCWRWQRQLNKAISFPVVCRKQLSATATAPAATTTRSPPVINLLYFNWSAPHCDEPTHTHTHAHVLTEIGAGINVRASNVCVDAGPGTHSD